jgi:uncharacterized lipoprotein YmbA
MMRRSINLGSSVLLLFLAAAPTGCGRTAKAQFYMLTPTATEASATSPSIAVVVGPVTVPGSVDRPQFVVQTSPNTVTLDEFNRWASPLADNIARVVASDLAVLLGTSHVAVAPATGFTADYRVVIDVQRFESTPGSSVLVEALWAVRKTGGQSQSGRTVATETVSGATFDALAAAHSRALATVSNDIAAAIRAEAGRKA